MPINTVLFDLDDTLYPASSGMMLQVDNRITDFVHRLLGGSYEEAREIRHNLFVEFGTTLNGLMNNYHVDVDEYLSYVHDVTFDELVQPDPKLQQMLHDLSAQKILFTNSPVEYAERIVRRLGIDNQISDIFDIRRSNLVPKPRIEPYELVLNTLKLPADKMAFVEDTLKNLVPAHQLGMTTFLISNEAQSPAAKYVVPDIYTAIEQMYQLVEQ